MARPNLRRPDANLKVVNQDDPAIFGAERTDGKRWNHVQTIRYGEMLMPADHGLRHCETAKVRKQA